VVGGGSERSQRSAADSWPVRGIAEAIHPVIDGSVSEKDGEEKSNLRGSAGCWALRSHSGRRTADGRPQAEMRPGVHASGWGENRATGKRHQTNVARSEWRN